jgi:hypothetical protein
MSLKNPVTRPGIDPVTVRLVAQRLNHYATLGPRGYKIAFFNLMWMKMYIRRPMSIFGTKSRQKSHFAAQCWSYEDQELCPFFPPIFLSGVDRDSFSVTLRQKVYWIVSSALIHRIETSVYHILQVFGQVQPNVCRNLVLAQCRIDAENTDYLAFEINIFYFTPRGLLYNEYRVFPGGKAAGAWCWPPTPF